MAKERLGLGHVGERVRLEVVAVAAVRLQPELAAELDRVWLQPVYLAFRE